MRKARVHAEAREKKGLKATRASKRLPSIIRIKSSTKEHIFPVKNLPICKREMLPEWEGFDEGRQ